MSEGNGSPTANLMSIQWLDADGNVLPTPSEALYDRISVLTKQLNAAVHERDALREQLSSTVRDSRIEPALTIHCDVPHCTSRPLTCPALPPEDAIPGWVRGMGWRVDGDEHYCPRCRP